MNRFLIACLWLLVAFSGTLHAQTVVYIHTDALGSVVAETDANRNVLEQRREYEPYGQQLAPAVKNGPGYTGHVQDAGTGLVYMQQRYYDPGIGLFLSVDPVTALDNGDIRHFNRYAYAYNNPYKFTDPDGRCPNCVTAAIGGGVGFLVGTLVNAGAQYLATGKVDVSDALIAGGSAGLAGAAIGFNPALAANPAAIAAISGVTNVAGSVASDVANGVEVSGTKAVIAGVAGTVAGPLGARAGNAVENAMGARAASVVGEVSGAAIGEGTAAGLTVAGSGAVNAATRVEAAVGKAAAQVNDAVQQAQKRVIDEMNPSTGK